MRARTGEVELGREPRMSGSVCLWWYEHKILIVVWCSDLGTLRHFLGHVRIGVEGSRGPY